MRTGLISPLGLLHLLKIRTMRQYNMIKTALFHQLRNKETMQSKPAVNPVCDARCSVHESVQKGGEPCVDSSRCCWCWLNEFRVRIEFRIRICRQKDKQVWPASSEGPKTVDVWLDSFRLCPSWGSAKIPKRRWSESLRNAPRKKTYYDCY